MAVQICALGADAPHAPPPKPGRSFVPIEAQRKPDGSKWVTAPIMQTKGSKFVKFQEARLQVNLAPVCVCTEQNAGPGGIIMRGLGPASLGKSVPDATMAIANACTPHTATYPAGERRRGARGDHTAHPRPAPAGRDHALPQGWRQRRAGRGVPPGAVLWLESHAVRAICCWPACCTVAWGHVIVPGRHDNARQSSETGALALPALPRAGLLTSTYLEVMAVTQTKAGYADMAITPRQVRGRGKVGRGRDEGRPVCTVFHRHILQQCDQAAASFGAPVWQVDAINTLGAEGNVFERLAASIAPEIFGMREVKKASAAQTHFLLARGGVDTACMCALDRCSLARLLRWLRAHRPRLTPTRAGAAAADGGWRDALLPRWHAAARRHPHLPHGRPRCVMRLGRWHIWERSSECVRVLAPTPLFFAILGMEPPARALLALLLAQAWPRASCSSTWPRWHRGRCTPPARAQAAWG